MSTAPSVPRVAPDKFPRLTFAAPSFPHEGWELLSLFDRVKRTLRLSQIPTCNSAELWSRVASLGASLAGAEAPIPVPIPPPKARDRGLRPVGLAFPSSSGGRAILMAIRRASSFVSIYAGNASGGAGKRRLLRSPFSLLTENALMACSRKMAQGPRAEWFQAQALKCIGLALGAKDAWTKWRFVLEAEQWLHLAELQADHLIQTGIPRC
jgi:hypothetical protein